MRKSLSQYFTKDLIIGCPIFWENKYCSCVTLFLKKYYSYAQILPCFLKKIRKKYISFVVCYFHHLYAHVLYITSICTVFGGYQFTVDFCVAEVLPLVEFVLEDGITDEEAIQILDLSIPKQKREEKNWQESRMGGILSIKLHAICCVYDTSYEV